jgi:hypothetical protein
MMRSPSLKGPHHAGSVQVKKPVSQVFCRGESAALCRRPRPDAEAACGAKRLFNAFFAVNPLQSA